MTENHPNRTLTNREVRPNTTKKWKDSAKSKAATVQDSGIWLLLKSLVQLLNLLPKEK